MFSSKFKNAWLLTAINALAFSATPMILLIGSLVGAALAPNAKLATLPLAMVIVGAAAGVIPATLLMKKFGRRTALFLYMSLGIVSCLLASHSLQLESFILFNGGCFLLGATNAALQQIRFAAMESVPADQSATAASMIMSGGIIAAIAGPELAVIGRTLTAIEYQGSFYLVTITLIAAGIILFFYQSAPAAETHKQTSIRPLIEIIKNPSFVLAVCSAATAYLIMAFIMTGTPISMHNHHGHSLLDTKWVLQSHIAAMFLPSLIAPLLFKWFSIRLLMTAGLACFGLTIIIGSIDTSVMGFWFQLVILGIGWNFMFLSGTALLPSTYRQGEQYKAQAFNDGFVFSLQAIAALTAGVAISVLSWQEILLLCIAPMALMFILLIKIK